MKTNKPATKLTLSKATLKNLQALTVRSGVKAGASGQGASCNAKICRLGQ